VNLPIETERLRLRKNAEKMYAVFKPLIEEYLAEA
jgi:hypothetical protein